MDEAATVEGVELVEPVRIEAGCVVRGGRIGPNVTLEAGSVVERSELRDCVVGPEARLVDVRLHDSMVGGSADVQNVSGSIRVTDHSVVLGEG